MAVEIPKCPLCEEKDTELQQQRERLEKLADALKRIAKHPHNLYENNEGGTYGIGVTDGHRCAAKIAKAALKGPGGDAEKEQP